MNIKKIVLQIISEQAVLDINDVKLDSTLETLGINNLRLV